MTTEVAKVADGIIEVWYSGIQDYYYDGSALRCLFLRSSSLQYPNLKSVAIAACDCPVGFTVL